MRSEKAPRKLEILVRQRARARLQRFVARLPRVVSSRGSRRPPAMRIRVAGPGCSGDPRAGRIVTRCRSRPGRVNPLRARSQRLLVKVDSRTQSISSSAPTLLPAALPAGFRWPRQMGRIASPVGAYRAATRVLWVDRLASCADQPGTTCDSLRTISAKVVLRSRRSIASWASDQGA